MSYPAMAISRLPGYPGQYIVVKRGEKGYWPSGIPNGYVADKMNERWGVSPAMREAMLAGSMFGWDVPGADPERAEKLYSAALPLAKM